MADHGLPGSGWPKWPQECPGLWPGEHVARAGVHPAATEASGEAWPVFLLLSNVFGARILKLFGLALCSPSWLTVASCLDGAAARVATLPPCPEEWKQQSQEPAQARLVGRAPCAGTSSPAPFPLCAPALHVSSGRLGVPVTLSLSRGGHGYREGSAVACILS